MEEGGALMQWAQGTVSDPFSGFPCGLCEGAAAQGWGPRDRSSLSERVPGTCRGPWHSPGRVMLPSFKDATTACHRHSLKVLGEVLPQAGSSRVRVVGRWGGLGVPREPLQPRGHSVCGVTRIPACTRVLPCMMCTFLPKLLRENAITRGCNDYVPMYDGA